jgi:hypothetical protein
MVTYAGTSRCECGSEHGLKRCTYCERVFCEACSSDPSAGLIEDWYHTGWDICNPIEFPECQSKAISDLVSELNRLQGAVRMIHPISVDMLNQVNMLMNQMPPSLVDLNWYTRQQYIIGCLKSGIHATEQALRYAKK